MAFGPLENIGIAGQFGGPPNCCCLGGAPNNAGMQQQQMLMLSMMNQLMSILAGGGQGTFPNLAPGFGAGAGNSGFGGQQPGVGDFLGSRGGNGAPQSQPGRDRASQPGYNSGEAAGPAAGVGAKTGDLVDIPGGKVDSSIAGNVTQMMAAARRDGVELKISSSFRSRASQERLYAAYRNGTGNLAARPGTSNHESGLALDFRNTPGAYSWLKANAGRFGLKNLPSEPWHYSTTGR